MTPHWDGPGLAAWAPWSPSEVAARLADVGVPWAVVGGHAIDLWLGRATRSHGDIEIEIARSDFSRVRGRFHDCVCHSVGDGEVHRLSEDETPPPQRFQVWLLERTTQHWRLDLMLQASDHHWWRYRRDPRIVRPLTDVILQRDGVPYLAPECVLLYKAKAHNAKDEADFAAVLPTLNRPARDWLSSQLTSADPWREHL